MSWTTTTKKSKLYQITGENTRDLMHPETEADMVTVDKTGTNAYSGTASNVQTALKETYEVASRGGALANKIYITDLIDNTNLTIYGELTPASLNAWDVTARQRLMSDLCILTLGYNTSTVERSTFYKIGMNFSSNNVYLYFKANRVTEDIYSPGLQSTPVYDTHETYITIVGEWNQDHDDFTVTSITTRKKYFAYDSFASTTVADANTVASVESVKQALSTKLDAAPNGADALISNGKISTTYIPDSILGQLVFGGTVTGAGVATLTPNAKAKLVTTSDSITLTNDTTTGTGYGSNIGIFYVASSDGNFASLGLKTGDWLLSLGTKWDKVDNTDEVTSVNGSTGAVNLYASNLPLSALDNTTILSAIGGRVESNTAITAGTATKITYDSKGLVTGGASLEASDIPSLDASKITSGTFADARIASASTWNAMATAVSTGSGTHSVVTVNSQGIVTGGGNLIEIGSKSGTNTPSNDLAIGGLFFEEV